MGFETYRQVLRVRDVRRVVLLGLVIRIPLWASNVILTLHVVAHLHRSYGEAGALTGVATVALAISAPWRGRRLDKVGLRAAVAPSLVILAVCWSIAPFLGYWPLLVIAFVAGLFVVPTFSIVRQSLIHSVPEDQRKTAIAVDSVALEISFMIGPAIGVLLATYWNTPWALFTCQFGSILGSVLLWFANPALRSDDHAEPTEKAVRRSWMTTPFWAVLIASAAATLVLTGTDVGVVAALRHMHHQSWIGWVLGIWGLGSALGGVVYGALHRTIPAWVLLGLLAGTTLPVVLAGNALVFAALLLVAGLFCAPTLTATVDALSRVVPERVRGEALGWHGAALTIGSAAGAPLAGVAIDHLGWHGGFIVPAIAGLAVAAVLAVATSRVTSSDSRSDADTVDLAAVTGQ